MDGIHDCGGMHGFGPVEREENEPYFHAEWERRAFALTMAMPYITLTSDDHFRRDIENMAPEHYLRSSYYEKWFVACMVVGKELGLVTEDELSGGEIAAIPASLKDNLPAVASNVWTDIQAGASQSLPDADVPQGFSVGERIRTVDHPGEGHTRLPRYARGKTGIIESVCGTFIFADANAARYQIEPVWQYSVEFTATELWGGDATPGDTVAMDLFEPYLIKVAA